MAGHFVVWRLSVDERDQAIATFGATWTGLAHAAGVGNGDGGVFPGWTGASRDLLNRIRGGCHNPPNRNGLPPHRYLEFQGGSPSPAQVTALRSWYWTNDLNRPTSAGFGMVGLSPAATVEWAAGRKADALLAQIRHGATSVEVYYLGRAEMT